MPNYTSQRVGNTTVTTPGKTSMSVTNRSGNTAKIGGTSFTGNSNVNINSSRNTQNKQATPSTAQSYSPTGVNPMTQQNGNQPVNTSPVGVRGTMQSAGFDNYNIGYDNKTGAVTYNGTPVVIPSYVENGTSYAPEAATNRGLTDYVTNNGYFGVRDALNDRGIRDDVIGYDNGYVTVDGVPMIQPEYNIGGTTYSNDEYGLNDATKRIYDANGTPLVSGRQYASAYGLGSLVNWDGSQMTIGGVPVDTKFVQDGNAYATQQDVERALQDYRDRTGMIGNAGVNDLYEDRYGGVVDTQLNNVLNREPWQYDLENDIAWQAYKNQYTRLAEDALADTLNKNNSSLNGGSSAAITEAMANRDNYLTQLTDKIPDLIQYDFDRYNSETDRLRQNLDNAYTIGNDYYNRMYAQNRDAYSDMTNSAATERQQKIDEANLAMDYGKYLDERAANQQSLWQGDVYNKNYAMPLWQAQVDQANADIANTQADTRLTNTDADTGQFELGMDKSVTAGNFIDEIGNMLGLQRNEQGLWVDPYTNQVVTPYSGVYNYAYNESKGNALGNTEGQYQGIYNSKQNGWLEG